MRYSILKLCQLKRLSRVDTFNQMHLWFCFWFMNTDLDHNWVLLIGLYLLYIDVHRFAHCRKARTLDAMSNIDPTWCSCNSKDKSVKIMPCVSMSFLTSTCTLDTLVVPWHGYHHPAWEMKDGCFRPNTCSDIVYWILVTSQELVLIKIHIKLRAKWDKTYIYCCIRGSVSELLHRGNLEAIILDGILHRPGIQIKLDILFISSLDTDNHTVHPSFGVLSTQGNLYHPFCKATNWSSGC